VEETMAKRILIVDDNMALCKGLAYILGKKHDVHFAGNGEEGVRMMRAWHPHLVLLDVVMPDRDGFSVLATMKDLNRKTPVVMLTVLDSTEQAVKAMKLGASDFLTKPIDRRVLEETVEEFLANHRPPSEAIIRTPSLAGIFDNLCAAASKGQKAWLFGESGTGKRTLAMAVHLHDFKPRGAFCEINLPADPRDDMKGLFDAAQACRHFNRNLGFTLYARAAFRRSLDGGRLHDLRRLLRGVGEAAGYWRSELGMDADRFQLVVGIDTGRGMARPMREKLDSIAGELDAFTGVVPTLDLRRADIEPLSKFITRRISRTRPRPWAALPSRTPWGDIVAPTVRNVSALEAFLREQLAL
jgi:CheY-like chemotaxis protein